MKYKYTHNNQTRNGQAENTQHHILYKTEFYDDHSMEGGYNI